MELKIKYPQLFQFLAGYFAAYYYEPVDEKIINLFVKDVSSSKIIDVINAISNVLGELDIYGVDIIDESNRYFKNNIELTKWLIKIRDLLKASL